MTFREIALRRAYSSDLNYILSDFYIPTLSYAIAYDRLAGFFSSTSLAIAARGILGLLRNDGTMRLIVSPRLSKDDAEMLLKAHRQPEDFIGEKMSSELDDRMESEFVRNHVYALGWLVANKKLEIRVALVYNDAGLPLDSEAVEKSGIFHQKVGILKDTEGNIITFSGSVNESATGWLGNIEEFKVFRSWEPIEEEYVEADVLKFSRFWNGSSQGVRILDIPEVFREKLIRFAPQGLEELDLDRFYVRTAKRKEVALYDHQQEAVDCWIKNKMMGILEMATGTGKTFAALACLEEVGRTYKKAVFVISCPYHHLIEQWCREIDKFGIDVKILVADSTNRYWKHQLVDTLIDISLGHRDQVVVIATHRTFSSNNFVKIMRERKDSNSVILLIADEVHGLGAAQAKAGLIEEYDCRLGLSATPKRWFDPTGTKAIYQYFDDVVFEFSLKDAVSTTNPTTGKTYLTPYRYVPKFVGLTDDELEEYAEMSRIIATKYHRAKTEEEMDEILERLYFKRADVIKNANGKYQAFEEILDELSRHVTWCLVYCSPQQIDAVMQILNRRGITTHRFTMEEGTSPERRYGGLSEREFILRKFAEGEYQVLVAMKCLDEGVDVPPARVAILMASSGNPREYVQRIGRVIRPYLGKHEATIYDLIVAPFMTDLPPELREIEWRVFQRELNRYEEIAGIAMNNAEALAILYEMKDRLRGVRR